MRVAKSTVLTCGLALLLVLAGCNGPSGQSTPPVAAGSPGAGGALTGAGTPTPTPTPSAVDRAAQRQTGVLVAAARSRGIGIESFATRNDTVIVRYYANSTEDAVRRGTFLAFAYSEVVNQTWRSDATWNATQMDAIAVTANGTTLGRYRMMAYWGVQYADGVYGREGLGSRIDAAFAASQGGQLPPADQNLLRFGRTIDQVPDTNLTALFQRGDTAFVTIENRTSNGTEFRSRFRSIVQIYGAFASRGFTPEYVQLEVRDENGDVRGWYRISSDRATFLAESNSTAVLSLIRDSYWAEGDNLEG